MRCWSKDIILIISSLNPYSLVKEQGATNQLTEASFSSNEGKEFKIGIFFYFTNIGVVTTCNVSLIIQVTSEYSPSSETIFTSRIQSFQLSFL